MGGQRARLSVRLGWDHELRRRISTWVQRTHDSDVIAERVLCFGDSNTHGCPGDDPDYVRLPADRRWTGVLQGVLGGGYEVIEDGLPERSGPRMIDGDPGG